MGWLDKAAGAAKLAKQLAKEASGELADAAQENFGGMEWYEDLKLTTRKGVEAAGSIASEVTATTAAATKEFGGTDLGRKLGEKSRGFFGVLGGLPVLSLSGDVIRNRNGVEPLTEHLKQSPQDPERYLWLAEALRRSRVDAKTYRGLRSAVDPSYLLIGKAVRAVNGLGQEAAEPGELKLLRGAFGLSLQRLRAAARDQVALHVMARVYLVRAMPGEAARIAKLSWLANPKSGQPLVTLSRAYLAFDQLDNARRAAKKAVSLGDSVGFEPLADLVLLSGGESSEGLRRYQDLRSRVKSADREAYYGPSVSGVGILEGVGRAQWERMSGLFT